MLKQVRIFKTKTPCCMWQSGIVVLLTIATFIPLIAGNPIANSPATARAQGPETTGDPVFAALLESGMIEPLGHVRTIGDTSITLDWVYADTSILAAHVTITGTTAPANDPNTVNIMPRMELRDEQNNTFLDSSWSATADEADPTTISILMQFSTQFISANTVEDNYFTAIYGDNLPERVALTLAITLGEMESASGTSSSQANAETVEFDVDARLYGATTLQPARSETVNNLTVTLEEVTFTPAETIILLCYDLPDGGDWHPVVTLTADGNAGLLRDTHLTTLPDPSQVERCEKQSFGSAAGHSAQTLTVTVEALRTSLPDTREYWEAVRDALTEYGIVIDVVLEGGRYFDIVSKPDDMTDMELGITLTEVQQRQLPTVEGPWRFEIALR